MGVKSTVTLTRKEAIDRYVSMVLREKEEAVREIAERMMSNTALEDALEDLNDRWYRQEYNCDSGFDNFSIEERD